MRSRTDFRDGSVKKRKGPETIFRPNFRPNSCKWVRGRDLNPRPLGYESKLRLITCCNIDLGLVRFDVFEQVLPPSFGPHFPSRAPLATLPAA